MLPKGPIRPEGAGLSPPPPALQDWCRPDLVLAGFSEGAGEIANDAGAGRTPLLAKLSWPYTERVSPPRHFIMI